MRTTFTAEAITNHVKAAQKRADRYSDYGRALRALSVHPRYESATGHQEDPDRATTVRLQVTAVPTDADEETVAAISEVLVKAAKPFHPDLEHILIELYDYSGTVVTRPVVPQPTTRLTERKRNDFHVIERWDGTAETGYTLVGTAMCPPQGQYEVYGAEDPLFGRQLVNLHELPGDAMRVLAAL